MSKIRYGRRTTVQPRAWSSTSSRGRARRANRRRSAAGGSSRRRRLTTRRSRTTSTDFSFARSCLRLSNSSRRSCDTMKTSRSMVVAPTALVDGRSAIGPGPRVVERRGGPQDTGVVEATPDDLQPDRQPVFREAARHRRGGLAGQVEGERERDPGVRVDRLAGDLGRVVEADLEGRTRDRRRQQEVVRLEERARVLPPREPVEPRLDIPRRWVPQRRLDDPVEAGLDLRTAVDVRRHAGGDTAAEGLLPAVARRGPARVDALHPAAQLSEGRGGFAADGADRGVHRVDEAEV